MKMLIFTLLILFLVIVAPPITAESIYSPVGKRDPFKPPLITNSMNRKPSSLNPLEQFTLEQIQLRAVLAGLGEPRAMFEDPKGQAYIFLEGQTIGRERATVSRILKSEVIVTQKTSNHLGEESLFERVYSLKHEDEGIYLQEPSREESGDKKEPLQAKKAPEG